MKKVMVDSFNIVSALGSGAEVNFDQLLKGNSGVTEHYKSNIDSNPIWVSLVEDNQLEVGTLGNYSHYEKLLIAAIEGTQQKASFDLSGDDTLFVFSTTKGNISLLETESATLELTGHLNLFNSAKLVTTYFKNKNKPVVISNACISGVMALLYAQRILSSGQYRHVVVAGADTISKFVYSGFQSFQALSPGPCQPFSEARCGINLGEAGAAILLTAHDNATNIPDSIYIGGGSISNDSNHISGPSRNGAELSKVITAAIKTSGLTVADIDFVSAHGTATPYNDEMEAKAFHLSGLKTTPVNSLKGYFGHTLGAAGLVESAICILSLQKGVAVASKGYKSPGVFPELNILESPLYKPMKNCLKTASGFGGCNAAIVFSRN